MPMEILIIDAEKSHAEALKVFLRRYQYEAHIATDSSEVMLQFDNLNIQVVLADPCQEDQDTSYILKQIKACYPYTQLIIMIGQDKMDKALEQFSQIALGFLQKPVKGQALIHVLNLARNWFRAQDKIRKYEKRLEDLYQAESLYRQLFDEVPCYISVQDRNFRLTATNRRFKRDFGDEVGSYCYVVYKHRDTPCQQCPVAATFEDGKSHSTEEIVTSKSGKQYNVMTWTAPIRDASGQITQVMEMSTNITQIRQLQSHLVSLGLMLGSMSHGVKGMLTALDGGIYQLETGLARNDKERVNRAFENVKLMVDRIRKMVLEILYYAKSRELRYKQVDVRELTSNVVENARAMADKNGIEMDVNVDSGLGSIEVDQNWVQAALINFIENAVDACIYDRSKRQHKVSFNVKDGGKDRICFIVEDNGIGIDQETREKMFTLFFTSKGSQGTGLGLFIANRVISNHGGFIKVESQLQQGSRFEIWLPKSRPENQMIEFPNHGVDNGLSSDM